MSIGDAQRLLEPQKLRGKALFDALRAKRKSKEEDFERSVTNDFTKREKSILQPQNRLAQGIQFREDIDTLKTIQIDNRTGVIEDFVTENPDLESAIRKMGEEDKKLREIDDFIKSQTPVVEKTPQQKKGLAAFEQLRETPVGFVFESFERGATLAGKFFSSNILRGLGSMIMNSMVNNPTSVVNLEERQRIGENVSDVLFDSANKIEKEFDALVAKKPEELQINDLQDLMDLRKVTSFIIEGVPTTAALALLSVATGGRALIPVIFVSVTGSATKELMERDDMSLPQKLATAQTIAAVESALEVIGLGTITDAAKKGIRRNVLRAIRGEGATEAAQEVNEILQKEGIEPFKSQQAWAHVLMSGIAGMTTGGVLGAAFQTQQLNETEDIILEPIKEIKPISVKAAQEVRDISRPAEEIAEEKRATRQKKLSNEAEQQRIRFEKDFAKQQMVNQLISEGKATNTNIQSRSELIDELISKGFPAEEVVAMPESVMQSLVDEGVVITQEQRVERKIIFEERRRRRIEEPTAREEFLGSIIPTAEVIELSTPEVQQMLQEQRQVAVGILDRQQKEVQKIVEEESMLPIQELINIGREERNIRQPERFMRPAEERIFVPEEAAEAEAGIKERFGKQFEIREEKIERQRIQKKERKRKKALTPFERGAEAIGVPPEQIAEEAARLSTPQNTEVKAAQKDPKTAKIPKEDTDAIYQEAQNVGTLERIKKALRPTFTNQENMSASESIVGSVSSGLNSINTVYGTALRSMEFRKNQLVKAWTEQSLDFFRLAKKMTRRDRISPKKDRKKLVLDIALANGNLSRINQTLTEFDARSPSKADPVQSHQTVTNLLDEVFDLAQSRDINFGRVEVFFPRVVTDLKGLTKKLRGTEFRGIFSETIKEAERKKGRTLTEEEQLAIIDRTISYRVPNAKTSNSIKERRITTLNADLYEHYATSEQALNLYFQRMANAIAQQEFFRDLGIEPEAKNIDLDTAGLEMDQISTSLLSEGLPENLDRLVLKDIQSGRLKPQDENKLKDLLTSRFNFQPMHPALRRAKTLSVGILLGRGVTSTVRQFSEIGIAFYRSGVYSTGKAAIMAFSGRSKITMKDLGIEDISAAFVDMGKTGRLTDIMLRVNLFRGADRLSKETQVNAEMDALARKARRNKLTEKDNRIIDAIFGKAPQIKAQMLEDLKAGNVTQDVKLLAFHDISGYQPISLSELPPAYFNVKNGRIFYTFKTFQAKRIDFIREEALRDMFSKDRTKKQRVDALGRMVLLATILGLTELGSLTTILWMRGQMDADDFPDKFWDSMMRSLFGINKYAVNIAERDGIATALTEEFTGVPLTFADDIGKDLWSFFREDGQSLKTIESIRNTTLIGEAYYFWMGAGKIKNVDRYLRSVREEARERKFSRIDRIAILSTTKRYFNNRQISSRQRDNVLRLLNENELSRLPESTVNNFFQQMKQEIIEVTGIPETLFQK